jgi:acyl-CoA thioesterase FadM
VESFPFVHRETVRFRDLDGMGHVNNAVFSTYLEQARLAWFGETTVLPLQDVILARTEIDFRSPVAWGETVEIGVRPFTARHEELRARVRAALRRPNGRRGEERARRLRL